MLFYFTLFLIVLVAYCFVSVVYVLTYAFGPTSPNAFMMFPLKMFIKLTGKNKS
jgi:hypothetical protein